MHNRPPDPTKRSKARDYIWLGRHLQPPPHALCWHAAAEITLQHQEHADGSGDPKGLREIDISPGALIINIVDTFNARTHERAHQALNKRPLLRAFLEINNLASRQFSTH